METTIDAKGRVVIPSLIRKRLGIEEETPLLIEERKHGVLLKPILKKKKRIEDFFGLKVKRTGKPEWITPKEIKSIWE
jgi:AbrB family looped-hinge helix DNA binding protein